MRFWHQRLGTIPDFILANKLFVTFVDLWGETSYPSDISGIAEYFAKSEDPLKDDAAYYALVHPSDASIIYDLKRAIKLVESGSMGDAFLLQQYPDGGLISFSRAVLPFQTDAQEARWWKIEDVELTPDRKRPWRPWPRF